MDEYLATNFTSTRKRTGQAVGTDRKGVPLVYVRAAADSNACTHHTPPSPRARLRHMPAFAPRLCPPPLPSPRPPACDDEEFCI